MKRYFLWIALALMTGSAMAQPALSRGGENKFFTPDKLAEARYVGQLNRQDVWLTEGKKHQLSVATVNSNLWPEHEVLLPKTADMELLAATLGSQRVGVLVADRSQKRATLVGRFGMNVSNYELESKVMDTLTRFSYGKKDECLLWAATSPNGQYTGLIAVVTLAERQQYRATAMLFDADMNRLWENDVEVGTLEQIVVTDEGRIVGLGMEEQGGQTVFVFTSIDGRYMSIGSTDLKCGPLREVRLVGVAGSHAMVMATVGVEGGRKMEHLCSGELALSFHLDSSALTGYTLREWQNEDICIFYNKPTKKVQKEMRVEDLAILEAAPMSYGFSAVMGRQYRLGYTSSAGNPAEDYCAVGMHWIAVDTLGHIRWVRNLRRADSQEESGEKLGIGLVEANGKTALVKQEQAKYPAQYDIAKEGKAFKVGDKGNIVVYSADETGAVEKLVVEKGTKHSLVRAMVRPNGNLVMLTAKGDKTRMAELMYKY